MIRPMSLSAVRVSVNFWIISTKIGSISALFQKNRLNSAERVICFFALTHEEICNFLKILKSPKTNLTVKPSFF